MLGIRRLALLARAGLIVEIAGTLVLGAYLLLFDRNQDFGVIFDTMGAGGGAGYLGAFLAAALFSVWIFYGFEACGDIAEEVHNPSQKVPRAMQLTLAVGGATSFFLAIALILAVPDIGAVMSGADASPIDSILLANFGETGSTIALALILFAFVSCTIAIQGAAIRLVYSSARDGMVPASRALSSVHPRLHMPAGAVLVAVVVPALITLLPSATVTIIITFAVVGIYIGFQSVVLASVIARARGWRPGGTFNLGRWGMPVNLVALVYGVSAIVILSFKTGEGLESFVDRWLVPISAGVVFVLGLVYLLIARPTENIRADARADSSDMG
jgi:amino acid transporter